MSASANQGVEQVALRNLIDNAYETFEKSMLSISGRIVLWGSFTEEKQLTQQYLRTKGMNHLLDGRRTLNESDADYLDDIEDAASDAFEYRKWAREKEGQPICQEAMVTYCSAFENCLKTIAVAFLLVNWDASRRGLERPIYVPGPELTKARKTIRDTWESSSVDEIPRVQIFFENEIRGKNPINSGYEFSEIAPKEWDISGSSFKLRNAIVHSMARPSKQIELGDSVFHPGWEIELTARNLRAVKNSFETVLRPFSIWSQI